MDQRGCTHDATGVLDVVAVVGGLAVVDLLDGLRAVLPIPAVGAEGSLTRLPAGSPVSDLRATVPR
jgi:hypothetical protein